jgi:hypothetical protein
VYEGTLTSKWRSYLSLFLITVAALLIHGYHPGAEDAEIYIPAIKKILNPVLYPFGAEFFLNHARLTLFDELIAASVRISHLSFDFTVFVWYGLSIFLTLLACWQLSGECFREPEARWAGVMLVAALLTIPVAGTSLYIADQYLTSRSIVTFALLFAIWNAWRGRKTRWILWSVIALCIHPLMAGFGISYSLLLWWMKRRDHSFVNVTYLLLVAVPFGDLLRIPSRAYQQAVSTRSYFFLLDWQWYEWLGALAPLLLLWLIGRSCRTHSLDAVWTMSRALTIYGFFYLAIALVLTIPPQFEALARFQPMRSLHLIYILMFLFGGGVLGKWLLRRCAWRWAVLFLPLCGVMFLVQRQLFPTSRHIELPSTAPANDWLQAFDWIRQNTPSDALFAIDPNYMIKDDQHGFRAIAERSRLADSIKDSGAVTMFPELPAADHWLEQVTAQSGWEHFHDEDFRRLKNRYGISWAVLQRSISVTFPCPYENPTLRVCRVN